MAETTNDFQRRGLAGILLVSAAILLIAGTAAGYAIWWTVAIEGREATGPRVTVAFDGCTEAQAVVAERVSLMGLPGPTFATRSDGFDLTVQLPEAERVQATIPADLATVAHFTIREGDDGPVLVDGLEDASIEPVFMDVPHLVVQLTRADAEALFAHQTSHLEGHVTAWIDEAFVGRILNNPAISDARLKLDKLGASDRERLDFAASRAILLDAGPLPCALTVASVEPSP